MEHALHLKMVSMNDIVSAGCCDINHIIETIEKLLVDYKKGKIQLPDKISQIFDEKSQDRINCMPSTLLEEKICGVKWVSVFPDNPRRFSLQNVSGIIILSETEHGFPIAVMDGTLITALRTACMGAVGAKYLARQDSRVYGSIGAGAQAIAHFMAIKKILPNIDTCYVASRTPESEKRFIDRMKEKYPEVRFIGCNSDCSQAACNSDIVVTAVSCQKPLLRADAVRPGTYYCHVGGWEDEYEVPLKASKIVCDDWHALKHRGSPTLARMYRKGILKDTDIYANLAEIVDETKPGRENEQEITYFNSIGLSFIDVGIAYDFYKKVSRQDQFGRDWFMQEDDPIQAMMRGCFEFPEEKD